MELQVRHVLERKDFASLVVGAVRVRYHGAQVGTCFIRHVDDELLWVWIVIGYCAGIRAGALHASAYSDADSHMCIIPAKQHIVTSVKICYNQQVNPTKHP